MFWWWLWWWKLFPRGGQWALLLMMVSMLMMPLDAMLARLRWLHLLQRRSPFLRNMRNDKGLRRGSRARLEVIVD